MVIISKIVVILTGIALLVFNLVNISKKKMDIGIGSWWTIMSVIVIVFGALFDFTPLLHLVRVANLTMIYLLVVSLVAALYIYGMYLTDLKKKSDEVTMWVSYAKSFGGANTPADNAKEDKNALKKG